MGLRQATLQKKKNDTVFDSEAKLIPRILIF